MASNPVDILMMEDDIADVKLTEKSFETSGLSANLRVVSDGKEGMQYLRRQGVYTNAKRPDLILLDLNMPKMDGRQVIHEIKNDQNLKTIPVVILTTSAEERDIALSYSEGTNCYVTKPFDFDQFQIVIRKISEFWFTVAKLPKG